MKSENWFRAAQDYWENVPATVDGMLGGLGQLSDVDLRTSRQFLAKFFPTLLKHALALDVGAGIGRVSKNLLLDYFQKVALLEPNEAFLAAAKTQLKDDCAKIFQCTIQDFDSKMAGSLKFDMIWIQWVLIYVSDYALINFLLHCRALLTPDGKIVVKDNVLPAIKPVYDQSDHSVIRSQKHFENFFTEAGMTIYDVEVQTEFPGELYPVYMWHLGENSSPK